MKTAASFETGRAARTQRDNTGMDGLVPHTSTDRWTKEGNWVLSQIFFGFGVLLWEKSMKCATLSV